MKTASLLLALSLAGTTLGAQTPATVPQAIDSAAARSAAVTSAEIQHGTATPEHHEAANPCEEYAPGDIITPHITDAHCLEVPSFPRFWEPREVVLPRWAPLHIGGVEIDMSPTKHVVMLIIASLLCCAVLITGARQHVKRTKAVGQPKGFATGIEAMMLYIRQEVAVPNLGHHGEAYVPFILTIFWFVLFANLLGLIPFGSTATGNISVTATLAIITFLVVEGAGIRANGFGYLSTIFYWNKELPMVVRVPMFFLMTPIEFVGKLTKPFALAIRLFANMTAGHIVVLAMISLIFTFHSYWIGIAPLGMAVAIMFLELFVAFLQAFIFALLASVFIGQIREAHH
jgi:F-type H+-transporting ATPase subunit a